MKKAPRREHQDGNPDTPSNQTDVRASTDLARWLFCVYNYITLNIVLSSLSVYVSSIELKGLFLYITVTNGNLTIKYIDLKRR